MKKRTIAIVSIALVLAILAVGVIATFPSYLFEEEKDSGETKPTVQSEAITESVEGDDQGNVGGNDNNGVEGVLPDVVPEDTTTDSQAVINNLDTIASDGGAKLMAETSAFPDGTEFKVNKLGIFNKKYYRARHYVRDFASQYTIYEITAQKDGKDVQPIAAARVVIDIPEDYDIDKVEIYYVLSGGGVQKLNCTIDKDAKTATVSFMQSGIYILIEKDKAADTETSSQATSTESEESSSSDTSSNSSSSDQSTDSSSDADSSQATDSSENSDSSENNSSDSSSSDGTSSEDDPYKDSMDGWTPWY